MLPLLTVFVSPEVQIDTEKPADAAEVLARRIAELINHRRDEGERCTYKHIVVRLFHSIESSVVLLNGGDISMSLELHEEDINHREDEFMQEFAGDIAETVANHGPFSLPNDRHPVVHCQVTWQRHIGHVVMF